MSLCVFYFISFLFVRQKQVVPKYIWENNKNYFFSSKVRVKRPATARSNKQQQQKNERKNWRKKRRIRLKKNENKIKETLEISTWGLILCGPFVFENDTDISYYSFICSLRKCDVQNLPQLIFFFCYVFWFRFSIQFTHTDTQHIHVLILGGVELL